ncbi:GNAT family N-acetyltransferase [bacterium]|nr:GNAT family N-acetyltransferase [bacterium]
MRYCIENLNTHHDRSTFSCGSPPLDFYLKKHAGQEGRKRVAVTYLMLDQECNNCIAGYYTLSPTHMISTELPKRISDKLPRYDAIPATLLGRLALDESYQGKGLGKTLLVNALKQSYIASQTIASFAVIVDAKNENAVSFYASFGFIPFDSNPHRLFLTMKTISQLKFA